MLGALALSSAAAARVLRVGKYKGIKGQYTSIQSAVSKARAGDWILVGPGDYKEHSGKTPGGKPDRPSGVLITKRNLYLRGMNRNRVIVDGTKPGSSTCSRKDSAQEFGPTGLNKGDTPLGLNGIMVWKARNVWVQNLTVCNYLHGSGDTGNEVWWNGGDGSGTIGGSKFLGSYLSTTSSYYKTEDTAAQYGIFSSNWNGGTWDHTYASNFNDSGYYIGACRQLCNQTINHGWGEYSALGYSGSNSGGSVIIKNSEFDKNEDGFDTNSQNGDNPPPQDGSCPGNGISPIIHTHSCWVFMDNFVHGNNNPDVPAAGSAAAGPVGTGMSMSGARNDIVMRNRFVHNGAWGVILVPYLDSGTPCAGGTTGPLGCVYDDWSNALVGNSFSGNGFYGHPTNGDFATLKFEDGHPNNCFSGNSEAGGAPLSPDAAAMQQSNPSCTSTPQSTSSSNPLFLSEVLCDSQVELSPGTPSPCPTGKYPRTTGPVMHPLPEHLKSMPNPCAGVPKNPWCPAHKHKHKHKK